jgi:hemerythrin superfamily protein
MLRNGAQSLTHDHSALNIVFSELHKLLTIGDVTEVYSKLDLFWARLAMHIRAEHLHLFPTILSEAPRAASDESMTQTWSVSRAEILIAQLRADHDFFMKELARCIVLMRELAGNEHKDVPPELQRLQETLSEIARRLALHNHLEETEIYSWVDFLSEETQAMLTKQIDAELANLPSRFQRDTQNVGENCSGEN